MKKKKTTPEQTAQLFELVVRGMQEKKGEDIVVIDLKNHKNAIADYFIICSGTSDTHADAIAVSIEDEVHKSIQEWPWHTEGKENKEWVLIDYVDVVAHVFVKEKRKFFGLEELWSDAIITRPQLV
jgi:ribosome-associated protein